MGRLRRCAAIWAIAILAVSAAACGGSTPKAAGVAATTTTAVPRLTKTELVKDEDARFEPAPLDEVPMTPRSNAVQRIRESGLAPGDIADDDLPISYAHWDDDLRAAHDRPVWVALLRGIPDQFGPTGGASPYAPPLDRSALGKVDMIVVVDATTGSYVAAYNYPV